MSAHPPVSAVALLLGLLAAPSPARTQTPSPGGEAVAILEGEVFDSTASHPLADARVVLWGTEHYTTTDGEGRFRLAGIRPGEYQIVFFHPRFQEFGISSGTRKVTVPEGEMVSVRLATPSMFTILSGYCSTGEDSSGASVIGRVMDAQSGVPLPGARVAFSWRDPSTGELHRDDARAGVEGWYSHCSLPSEAVVGARAEFLSRVGPRREVQPPGNDPVRLDFLLGDLSPARVFGTILDVDSSAPVAGAVVELQGTRFREVTDDEGRFQFEGVEPGEYSLKVDHLAYGTRLDTLSVGSGLDLRVGVQVATRPIELAPLTVTVEAAAMEPSVAAMGGHLISREEVDRVRHRSSNVSDILRAQGVPGIIVSQEAPGGVCIGIMPGQVRMFRNECEPIVMYVDNVRMINSEVAARLPAEAVDHMVIFRPVEAGNLFGLGGGNGVLMIYTKRGRR